MLTLSGYRASSKSHLESVSRGRETDCLSDFRSHEIACRISMKGKVKAVRVLASAVGVFVEAIKKISDAVKLFLEAVRVLGESLRSTSTGRESA
jgi:hypothetical protein